MTKNVWLLVGNIAALAGILGVNLVDAFKQERGWISFALVAGALAFIVYRAYKVSTALLDKQYPKGYVPVATYVRMATTDGSRYVYELFRHIQIKEPCKTSFQHDFQWSGSKDPKVTAHFHTCGPVFEAVTDDGRDTSRVNIKFARPRVYNEPEIVHLTMDIDDSDDVSQPFLAQKVDQPIQLLNFRIELLHATNGYHQSKATVSRKRLDDNRAEFEEFDQATFHPLTRSYTYHMLNPEPGFAYKIHWEKPRSRKPKEKAKPAYRA